MIRQTHISHVAYYFFSVVIACSPAHSPKAPINVSCDSATLDKVLVMPSLFSDSAGYRAFENAHRSIVRVPKRKVFTYHTKGQFRDLPEPEGDVTRDVFTQMFLDFSDGYEYFKLSYTFTDADMAYAAIHDGINVARQEPVWLPVFYRPHPLAGLNMVVIYQMVDSIYYGTGIYGWMHLKKKAIVKLYHQDAVLDTLYPDLRAKAPLESAKFRTLFNCLQGHFDKIYPSRYPKEPLITYDELGMDAWAYRDKPYRDIIRHHAWLTPDSVAIQLYCLPSDILRKYYRYGGESDLLFDSIACTYRNVPQGTPGAIDNAYDIRWEDLAIWIVYTYIGTKP